MFCYNCGKEIKSEFNNCPFCGKPVQIVPDYSIYDDDDLNVLLEGSKDIESKNNKAYIAAQKEKEQKEQAIALENKKQANTKKTILIISCVCVAVIIIAIIGKIIVDMNNSSSYDYQMKMADSAMFKSDYDEAEKYYLKALDLVPDDITARLELAELYIKNDDYDKAIGYLKEVIKIDSTNYNAYKLLYKIYEDTDDVDEILSLMKGVTDTKILSLFSDYSVKSPTIRLEEGTYSDEIDISISADKDLEIYYTLDGTDPIKSGKKYSSSIIIEDEGMHTLKAVAKNSLGVYSEVVSATYVISFEAPDDPVVSPDGGEFSEKTKVTIQVPSGCSVYYTWDGSDPDPDSETTEIYVSPLTIPEGYHILSVVIINDKTGLESSIYRGSFEYNND